MSSFVKDLFCSPRPFAPPVTRLSTYDIWHCSSDKSDSNTFTLAIGTHHLEYGFPSTHSTNSVSIALFMFTHLYRLASQSTTTLTTLSASGDWSISPTTFWLCNLGLLVYIFSIVFGRLYTAMHSFSDCVMGVILGVIVWAFYYFVEDWTEAWLIHAGWSGKHSYLGISLMLKICFVFYFCSTIDHYTPISHHGQPTSGTC